ncbi:MAG: amidohydrolase [Alphaproteobacteria bacterium]|jgi:amidohydrolase|nr:amidohydrolase [Alphaproteobacteria bacterium]MBU2040428.1 amidohydrolase [Alphaproteobacteria bacterium]MBU2126430.1 amidohydrolase [Alphaproteobacteria bacterium]MBU2209013.1 amidohydrolase [Alphaproteobacteria bacterium]MBU2291652.1 amidohydrolase [Alphaproteobacteria bacterium]
MTIRRLLAVSTLSLALSAGFVQAQTAPIALERIEAAVAAGTPRVTAWRRDLHANPELGFAETRTAAMVADHLRALGMEVRTGVGKTGVVGVLRGGRPGGTVALRADMDALPVLEATGLPFASTATGTYMGNTVPVAHACGHDAHVAMLMGAAEVLAGMKDDIAGTVVFIFQPAEEGAPPGEPLGGAALMIQEGALADPRPDAIFGLHVVPGRPGTVFFRPQGFMAASDRIDIVLHGRQTHGAWPWKGVDVIAASAQIVQTINTLTARTIDPTTTPTVFTIATLDAGVRYNIIPDRATLSGTLRTFDIAQRDDLVRRAEIAIDNVAETFGATAEFSVRQNAALVFNNEELSAWLAPILTEAAGAGNVNAGSPPTTVAEDFSYLSQEVPGVFYHLGGSKDGVDPSTSPPNHSPGFDVNESVLPLGVKTHVLSAIRFLERQ